MLRLQFRHNFLSRPFRLSDARPPSFPTYSPPKENVISGGRLSITREKISSRSADLRELLFAFLEGPFMDPDTCVPLDR